MQPYPAVWKGESKTIAVYFPKAVKPMGQVMELSVQKDAMVKEVLGHVLHFTGTGRKDGYPRLMRDWRVRKI